MDLQCGGGSRRRARVFPLGQPDHQHGDVSGGDAGNAAGLAERARLMGGELLARFDAQAVEGHVIKALREQLVLRLTEGFHLTALLIDVARIAQEDVDLFADGGRKPDVTRVDFGQIIIEDAGAAEEVGRADAAGC